MSPCLPALSALHFCETASHLSARDGLGRFVTLEKPCLLGTPKRKTRLHIHTSAAWNGAELLLSLN
jgi:hypothetical protein